MRALIVVDIESLIQADNFIRGLTEGLKENKVGFIIANYEDNEGYEKLLQSPDNGIDIVLADISRLKSEAPLRAISDSTKYKIPVLTFSDESITVESHERMSKHWAAAAYYVKENTPDRIDEIVKRAMQIVEEWSKQVTEADLDHEYGDEPDAPDELK